MSFAWSGLPPPEGVTEELLDPMAEAESLRIALGEVVRRVGRLLTSLRQVRNQRRALHAAWWSLRHLSLRPKEKS
jgi:hypothetical protein